MIRSFLLILGLATFLGGCALDTLRARLPQVSWPRAQNANALPAGTDPAYCYRTLGRIECYAAPLPASEYGRLVAYRGPPPRAGGGGSSVADTLAPLAPPAPARWRP
ncbi:MAG: hypothetical protein QGF33_09675 [Alphaproteobacteria bacterium]|nr:hypothetical protein [Alphaproteobacteria bacterium]